MKNISAGLPLTAAAAGIAASLLVLPITALAAVTILSDGFGTGSSVNDIPSWDEEGSDNSSNTLAEAAGSGNDSASPDGGRFAKIREDEWICRTVTTSGYDTLLLSYYWRGDSDAENSDRGYVEYKLSGGCSDSSGWTQLQNHDLSDDGSWSTQSAFSLPTELNDGSFLLRFRTDSSQSDEYFRVDGVLLTGEIEGGSSSSSSSSVASSSSESSVSSSSESSSSSSVESSSSSSESSSSSSEESSSSPGNACGNGNVQENPPQSEECDDGNTTDGDGCSSTCTIEDGYVCTGNPSECSPSSSSSSSSEESSSSSSEESSSSSSEESSSSSSEESSSSSSEQSSSSSEESSSSSEQSSSSSESSTSSESEQQEQGGEDGGDGAPSSGAHRGWTTSNGVNAASFIGRMLGFNLFAPPAFGSDDVPLSETEISYICSMQRYLAPIANTDIELFVARVMAGIMGRSVEFLWNVDGTGALQDESLCEAINEALRPSGFIAQAAPKPFFVDADGYPVTGNTVLDACLRGESLTAEEIHANEDRNGDPTKNRWRKTSSGPPPMTCGHYHTEGHWRMQNGVVFEFNQKTKALAAPIGYVVTPVTSVQDAYATR